MRYYRCCCGQCRVRSVVGPLALITVGVLFALDLIWGRWSIRDTWPVILIVIGAVKIVQRLASSEGHGIPPAPPTGERPNAT